MAQIREGWHSEQIRNQSLKDILTDLKGLQLEVYNIIKENEPITTEGISDKSGRRVHSITARVFELREMKCVEFAGHTVSGTTGRKVSLWKTKVCGTQLQLL